MYDNTLVWLDVETTGLGRDARILEVAVIVTDNSLNNVDEMHVLLTLPLGPLSEWAKSTFQKNGLVDACREEGVPPNVAEAKLVGFLRKFGDGGLVAAGSSVQTDLGFLGVWMPAVTALFTHQVVDVTSLMILQKRWGVEVPNLPRSRRLHRAVPDAEDSLELLRAYRNHWLLASS